MEKWRSPLLRCRSEVSEAGRIEECIGFLLTGERKILMSKKVPLKEMVRPKNVNSTIIFSRMSFQI